MSPAQRAARLRNIATYIRMLRQRVVAAELAVRGMDPERDGIAFEGQVDAVSELLQNIAQRLDEQAASLIGDAEDEKKVA